MAAIKAQEEEKTAKKRAKRQKKKQKKKQIVKKIKSEEIDKDKQTDTNDNNEFSTKSYGTQQLKDEIMRNMNEGLDLANYSLNQASCRR